MSLVEVPTETEYDEATITVLNPESENPFYRLLAGLFDEDVITVQRRTLSDETIPSDTVFVQKGGSEGGFAISSFESIRDELLLVNSDIYITGSRELEDVETPDVILSLNELPFTVTGYPENPTEKLLLIEISRHIEALAFRAGEGRLATGLQYLSRLTDEHGTRQVYTRLGSETDVDTHLYGVPDTQPSFPEVTIHGEQTDEIRQTWFVVYQSATASDDVAALIAHQTEPNTWEGCWTFDPDRVAAIFDHLDHTYN